MSAAGIGKIIFTEAQIQERVAAIAQKINQDYAGQKLIIVSVLKGSIYFVADLTRHLTMPLCIDFISIGVSPEVNNKIGEICFTKNLNLNINGQHVLLVEDVIGTGLTLGYICQQLEAAQPASLKICALLDKPAIRLLPIPVNYCCFKSDLFLVGYGLDYHEEHRNLSYLAEYRRG